MHPNERRALSEKRALTAVYFYAVVKERFISSLTYISLPGMFVTLDSGPYNTAQRGGKGFLPFDTKGEKEG
jgi:hypothetical protein